LGVKYLNDREHVVLIMIKKDPFNELQKYLKAHPELNKIMNQLKIDEDSYFKALSGIKSNIIIPKSTQSNNTYSF